MRVSTFASLLVAAAVSCCGGANGNLNEPLPPAMDLADVTGTWEVTYTAGGAAYRSDMTLAWHAETNRIDGSARDGCGESVIAGTGDSRRRSITWTKTYRSGQCAGQSFNYSGMFVGGSAPRLDGTWSGSYEPPNDRGTFQATRR